MNVSVAMSDFDLSQFDLPSNIDSSGSDNRNSHKYRNDYTANYASLICYLIISIFVAVSIATSVNVAQEVKLRYVRI